MATKRTYEQLEKEVLEYKKSCKKLREQFSYVDKFFNTIPVPIALSDASHRIKRVNAAFVDLFGYTPDEAIGRTVDELLVPPGLYEEASGITKKAEKGEGVRTRTVRCRKDGSRVHVILTVVPLKQEGKLTAIYASYQDITRLIEQEKSLLESEKKFRTLFNTASDAIFIHTPGGKFLEVNEVACSRYGYSKEELLDMRLQDLISPKYAPVIPKRVELLKRNGHAIFESEHIRKNGTIIPVEISARLIDYAGTPAILSIARDISERARRREEKLKLEARLRSAQRMEALGVLAGGVAHDFNNLLMGIQGNVSLMLFRKGPGDPDYKKLRNIEQYVEQGAGLTKKLLGFARGGKYEVKPTDPNELVKNTAEVFSQTREEIAVHTRYELEPWAVEVDRSQIEQVLLNLYINAWQAMPDGGHLYLETQNIALDKNRAGALGLGPGRYVKISVTDTGAGMDQATRERIFEPFFTTKKMQRGTGLGLASAYGIVKSHRGIIDVTSEKGKGSTFFIYLPASEKSPVREIKTKEKISPGTGTILLVDDEEMVLNIGEKFLQKLGYSVIKAGGGEEAVESYTENMEKIDLVVLDIIMPGMDGTQVFKKLREINPEVKVLLSSGYSLEQKAKEILDHPGTAFIQKPFNIEALSRKLKEMFG